eukprot:UN11983
MELRYPSFPVQYLAALPAISLTYITLEDALCIQKPDKILSKESFSTQQRDVFSGMIGAMGCSLFSFFMANRMFKVDPSFVTTQSEITYAMKWFALPISCMVFGVGNIARKRFFSPSSIVGKKTDELEMDLRYLENTTEQLVIFLSIHSLIGFCYPGNASYLIFNSCLFTCGRIFFCYGYLKHPEIPSRRAFGFASTF